MDMLDFDALLTFEHAQGRVRQLTTNETIAAFRKLTSLLEESDYYQALDPESDAAYDFRDDAFSEVIKDYAA